MNESLFIGMISGTSRDGVDAALVRFDDDHPVIIEALCLPYPAKLAESLDRLIRTGRRPYPDSLGELDEQLACHFSRAAMSLLEQASVSAAEVTAIGSHGQTVWHEPEGPDPLSIQLGDPGRIARQTGVVTVGDFRRADIEAGGQGAPLAPLLHRALFRPRAGKCVVLNLGGIANISIIDDGGGVGGFDTGPANCLLDAWIMMQRGEPFDRDGHWAAGGEVQTALLRGMIADQYFHRTAPKSTGIEYFNLSWLDQFDLGSNPEPRDIQATLAQLSAATVADSIRPHRPGEVLVCGGGAHNADLMRRLRVLLPGIEVRSTAELGLDPDSIEAVLFAWLARERLAERALDTCRITGARNPVMLGRIETPG